MKYQINFEGKIIEVESTQPQTALNLAFFGARKLITPIRKDGLYDNKNAYYKNTNPIIKLPIFPIILTNSNGDKWKTELTFSQFSYVGEKIKEDDNNGTNKMV